MTLVSFTSKHIKEAKKVIMYLQQDGCDLLMLPHNFFFMMMSKETNFQNGIL